MFSSITAVALFNSVMSSTKSTIQNSSDFPRFLSSWGCSSIVFFAILTGTQLLLKQLKITTGMHHELAALTGPCLRSLTRCSYPGVIARNSLHIHCAARPPFVASAVGIVAVAGAGIASSRVFISLYYDGPNRTEDDRKQGRDTTMAYGVPCALKDLRLNREDYASSSDDLLAISLAALYAYMQAMLRYTITSVPMQPHSARLCHWACTMRLGDGREALPLATE